MRDAQEDDCDDLSFKDCYSEAAKLAIHGITKAILTTPKPNNMSDREWNLVIRLATRMRDYMQEFAMQYTHFGDTNV